MVFEHDKNIAINDISFPTKIADMSRLMSRFVIFSNCKKSNISNPTIFAGGPTLGGGVEPGRANGAWLSRARPSG